MDLLAPVRAYIESLVHPSAQHDALTAARHRAFIAPRIICSVVTLAAFPIYLSVCGAPSVIELTVCAWLVMPILSACFVSCTGRLESAYVLSAVALSGAVMTVAAATGGIVSPAAIWLAIVPMEASLSASRRVVGTASMLALAAAGLLILLGRAGLLPASALNDHEALATLGVICASLYAASLASSAATLARTSSSLVYAEEERYRLLARNMSDVITRHGRDGAVLFMSPAGEQLFGARIGELQGHGLFERVHVADRPAYLAALGDAAALGESHSVEFRVHRDGTDAGGELRTEHVWIEMRCRPLDGTTRELVAVLRDVTNRKAHEHALEQARAEVECASAAKGRFLATMSHELRTPLNAIIGFSDMLKSAAELHLEPTCRADYASLINDSGKHLLGVINGILDMSKLETGNFYINPEPFAPGPVIGACCDLLALRAHEAGLTLTAPLHDSLPEIVADKHALQQILLNLLSNAIRFTDRGGSVSVTARSEAASMTIVVEDNGVGINNHDLARIGEPYFQAGSAYERRNGGTGLGLSIVKGLVALHGGELAICSRLGRGTRVEVRLPLDCARARLAQPPRSGNVTRLRIAKQPLADRRVQSSYSVNRGDSLRLYRAEPVKKRA